MLSAAGAAAGAISPLTSQRPPGVSSARGTTPHMTTSVPSSDARPDEAVGAHM